MKHRKTMGFEADAAETAALTIADPQATDRIFDACDWLQDSRARGGVIGAALSRLNTDDRAFACAVLKGKKWAEIGCPKRTFYWRLKKLEDFFA